MTILRKNRKPLLATNDLQLGLLSVIAVVSIIPSFGESGIRFLGVGIDLYRLFVPIAGFLIFLGKRCFVAKALRGCYLPWMIFVMYLIVHGMVMLSLSDYSDIGSAGSEIASVTLGAVVIGVFAQFDLDEKQIGFLFFVIRLALVFLLIVGFFELLTGWHSSTSFFRDSQNSRANSLFGARVATGFCYNENDYSALITCLFPACVFTRSKKRISAYFLAIATLDILNDANICTVALFFCMGIVLMASISRDKALPVWVIPLATIILLGLLLAADRIMLMISGRSVVVTLSNQLLNRSVGRGSMYKRITIYSDALRSMPDSVFLGFGPGSFKNYFSVHVSKSGLSNPHCFFIEVLFEFGVLAALLLLLAFLHSTYVAVKKKACAIPHRDAAAAIAIIASCAIASFAPSAFLGYHYQWLLVALLCSLLDNTKNSTSASSPRRFNA